MKRRYQLCLKIIVRCPNGKELSSGSLYHPGLPSKEEAIRYARRIMSMIPSYTPDAPTQSAP
jgi:hypothetical protein